MGFVQFGSTPSPIADDDDGSGYSEIGLDSYVADPRADLRITFAKLVDFVFSYLICRQNLSISNLLMEVKYGSPLACFNSFLKSESYLNT